MAINLDYLTRQYFYFDEPVPYKLKDGMINITPISLRQSEIFSSSVDILNIDKNSIPNAKIIQMSYLQFIVNVIIADEKKQKDYIAKISNILIMCLGLKNPTFVWDNNGVPSIYDSILQVTITPNQFDEIKRIIMYQNYIHFDDEYINPELKQAMDEVDTLKNENLDYPSLERRMAIISSHTGILKKDQEEMTLRSHSLLFEEVCGEVEFTTVRPISLLCGGNNQIDHWIFKKHKNKFEGYTKSIDAYTQSMGGAQAVKSSDTSLGDSYMQQINNFNK